MGKVIDIAGKLNAATTEGIVAEAKQIRFAGEETTVEEKLKNLNTASMDATEDINSLKTNTGIDEYPTFSEDTNYYAGDIVNYQGILFQFTTDHAAGLWIGTDVNEYNISKEVDTYSGLINIALSGANNTFYPNMNLTGYYTGKIGEVPTLSPESGKSCNIDVIQGDKYLIFTAINNNVIFVDIDDEENLSINTSVNETGTTALRCYLVTAGTNKLGFTTLKINGKWPNPVVIHIDDNSEGIYHRLIDLANQTENNRMQILPIPTIIGNNPKIDTVTKNGYFSRTGSYTSETAFMCHVANVTPGKLYAVYSGAMNHNMTIVGLNTPDDASGTVLTIGYGEAIGNEIHFVYSETFSYIGFGTRYDGEAYIYEVSENSLLKIQRELELNQGVYQKFSADTDSVEYPYNISYGVKVTKGIVYKIRLISGGGGNIHISGSSVTLLNALSEKWQYFIPNITGTLVTYTIGERHNVIELVQVGSLLESAHGGVQLNRYFFENAGARKIELTFKAGYYTQSGILRNDAPQIFKHVNIEVTPGNIYAILVRTASNMAFVDLNSIEDVEFGTVAGKVNAYGWNTNMSSTNSPEWQLRFIKPNTNYLGISLWREDELDSCEKEAVCYELSGGWLYDLITGNNYDGVTKEELQGILPQNFTSYGSYAAADGYITTQGICTNYGTTMVGEKLLKSVHFYANKAGRIKFGIGRIDQRNWAIVSLEFDVECQAGENNIDVSELGIMSIRNNYLFTYNNYYGDGCSIGYKLRTSSASNYYYYTDDVSSALQALDSEIAPNTAHLCLQYQLVSDDLIYTLKSDSDDINYWAGKALSKTAFNLAQNNVIKGENGKLYKLVVDSSGQLSASELKFNKITVFGNSIWRHSALASGWLSPVTDDQGTWEYYEPGDEGMSGMQGRGMAATQQEFDFRHLFLKGMQVNNPDVVVQGENIVNVERTLPDNFGYQNLLTSDVDVIIWRAGENVYEVNEKYMKALRRYILYFQERCPNALIILTGRFWKHEICDRITNDVAEEFGLPFIRIYMPEDKYLARDSAVMSYPVKLKNGEDVKTVYSTIGAGVGHPSNLGMYEIANLLLKVLGQQPLKLLHKVTIIDTSNSFYTADDEQIEGATYSIIFTGTVPTVSVKKSSDSSVISTSILNKTVYFTMPKEDVIIELS